MTQVAERRNLQPQLFRFSVTDYYRMAELGFFGDQRVELVDGKVFRMAPRGNRHEVALGLCDRVLIRAFGDRYWVRQQMSLNLQPRSAPEPDIAVVGGSVEDTTRKPTSALLVVEISDKTLSYDRAIKRRLYASSGILDYWIVNLRQNVLQVYRDPTLQEASQFTHDYDSAVTIDLSGAISPLALPDARIAVSQLLPSPHVVDE